MSVLIKGMKMPENCCICWFSSHDMCLVCGKDADDWLEERPGYCPLIEVPDHGDLIDIEVLRNLTGMRTNCSACNHCGVFGCNGDISTDYICGVLDDIPVVIPAERDEGHD